MERDKRIYRIWAGMKQRCNNPKHPAARWYHDKGIRVCQEWEKSFFSFQTWALKNAYFEGASIDRIDSGKGYNPENCRWITIDENRNRALAGPRKGVSHNIKTEVKKPKNTEERIVDLISIIAKKKGKDYAAGLVDGVNLASPRVETREETMAKIQFHLPSLDDSQLRMVSGFIRGIRKS